MAMVSNKFLAALCVKLEFHKHIRSNGAIIESQNREYVQDLQEVEMDAKGARDYWTLTKTAPKVLSLDSSAVLPLLIWFSGSLGCRGILHRCPLR